jgi:threonine/homoserine/homoserine lactone efflux protein
MSRLAGILMLGWGISFAGSLPLGTMNVAATQIAVRDGAWAGLIYSLGSVLIELIYVRTILDTMDWVFKRIRIFRLLGWITVLILLAMATGSFYAASTASDFGSSLPPISRNHFLYGALLSAINPLHFPFWFGWSSVLLNKGWLSNDTFQSYVYISGIGLGSISGFLVFIYGGNYLVASMKDKQYILNAVMGIILGITALIQLYKIWQSSRFKYKI